MKYFIVSDILGRFNVLLKRLGEVGFDSENKEHILVSVGNLFGSTGDNAKTFLFVSSLEERFIGIKGHTEDVFLELSEREFDPTSKDFLNGSFGIFFSLVNLHGSEFVYNVVDFISNMNDYLETSDSIICSICPPKTTSYVLNGFRKLSKEEWANERKKGYKGDLQTSSIQTVKDFEVIPKTAKIIIVSRLQNTDRFQLAKRFDVEVDFTQNKVIGINNNPQYSSSFEVVVLNEDV